MEKLLVTSNFSFSLTVFKRLVLQTCKNKGLFGKGLIDKKNSFGSLIYRHYATEKSLLSDPDWPNVKSEDLAETFHRLDSAHQNMSQLNSTADLDDLSVSSGSETGSMTDKTLIVYQMI